MKSQSEEEARLNLQSRFAGRYGVRRYEPTYKNMQALFAQGCRDNKLIREFLRVYFQARYGVLLNHVGWGRPFDHIELWGRDRTPLMLIGHPYGVSDDALETFAAIRNLGLSIEDSHESWYGHGTLQIRVYHPQTRWLRTGETS